jgi:hypothetical protein
MTPTATQISVDCVMHGPGGPEGDACGLSS